MKTKWIIKDWTGKVCFDGETFKSFDDAEEFLCETLGDEYDEDRLRSKGIINENNF